jgi:putative endopeptidase
MKKAWLIAGVAFSVAANAAEKTAPPPPSPFGPWGFNISGEDTAVVPGNNFFEFADGTYVKNLVIPPDKSRFGAFNILTDLSETRVHGILEAAAAKTTPTPTSPVEKAGAVYKAFMDEAGVEKLGSMPLAPDLALIKSVKTQADFARLLGLASKTFLGSLFGLAIEPDEKDPNVYAITLGQDGLALPDRDYYLTQQFADKRAKYGLFVEHILTLGGWPDAHAAAARVVAFETKIAEISWSRAESRDADKTYNPMSFAELQALAPGFDWGAYFAAADLGKPPRVVLGEKSAIAKIATLATATPMQTLQDWAALHLLVNAAPMLPKAFVDADFDFFKHTLQGQPQNRPRWKRAVAAAEAAVGEGIGEAYVAQYFPPEARVKMAALTHDLRDAFHRRLEHNAWMTPQTRQKALEKLATFDFQIGYPKKWRDYSGLHVTSTDLYGDVERGGAFEWAFWVGHLGKPTDRDQWDMTPQTVNAYNMPVFNEVVFPAAILQPPFFNLNADAAVNYGAIGGVIGHEMTHSFDDQGRKFDAKGRLSDWWTPEDVKRFTALATRYGAQFAAMDILPGAHINPDLTMGENIADLGGLTLALEAYHASLHGKPAPVIDGTTGDQRVFFGWAQVWRQKSRPDALRQQMTIDPHSPAEARVNGPIHNIDAWYSAFNVKPGEKLYLAPKDRVRIW